MPAHPTIDLGSECLPSQGPNRPSSTSSTPPSATARSRRVSTCRWRQADDCRARRLGVGFIEAVGRAPIRLTPHSSPQWRTGAAEERLVSFGFTRRVGMKAADDPARSEMRVLGGMHRGQES